MTDARLASPDTPAFAIPEGNLVPVSEHLSQMAAIQPSKLFLIKQGLEIYRQRYPDGVVYQASQGDGGASLPGVPEEVLLRAAQLQAAHGTSYDMPYGTDAFRRAVIEQYWGVDSHSGIGPQNVVATAGGRDALVKAYQAMLALGHGRQGDALIVSRVPWISYQWGAYNVGANVLLAPGQASDGWAYSEESLRASVDYAARSGRKVAGLVITSPDNPTGRTLDAETQASLGRAALRAGVAFVLYDWIYHYVTDELPMDLNAFLHLFTPEERQRLIFIDSITKSLGGSNIRNAHMIASQEVVEFIVARASHTVMAPFYSMAVAMAAYEMGYAQAAQGIIEPTNTSRKVLEAFLDAHDFTYIMGKGYYAFIHVGRWLAAKGWADSAQLGRYLAEEHGLAVVPGVFFSPYGGEWVRFSYALPPEKVRGAAERLRSGLEALAEVANP